MRLKLFLSVLLFCAFVKAQNNTELKDFINKNNVAIRTCQKNMVRESNSAHASEFKSIIKNQLAAVKLYNSDKKASYYFAFSARVESLNFLKKHSQGSTEYFEITDIEEKIEKSSSLDLSKVLSSDELKTIEDLDVMNTQGLKNTILIID